MFEQKPQLKLATVHHHVGDPMFDMDEPGPAVTAAPPVADPLPVMLWTLTTRVLALESRVAALETPWWTRLWRRLVSWWRG